MASAQAAVLLMMVIASAAAWWTWWRRAKQHGEISRRTSAPVAEWRAKLVVVVALGYIGLNLVAALRSSRPEPETLDALQIAAATTILNLGLVVLLLSMLFWSDRSRLKEYDLNLSDWREQIREGIDTGMASFLPVLLLLVAQPFRTEKDRHVLLRFLSEDSSTLALALIVFAVVIVAPLAEELLFRTILFGYLKTRVSATAAIVISSVAFAAIHGLGDGMALLPLALLLGWQYERRQRLLLVVVAHAFFNLVNIVLTLAER